MSKFSAQFSNFKTFPASFWLMCLNMLVFMMSFNMILPEMNEYLTKLGGEDYKWMILGLWTLAAAAARPFSGKIADNVSRKSVMYFGIGVSILICFLYPFFVSVTGFLILRFIHGFSTGFHPTGATALIADVIPKGKRGEAMGIFGVTISLGFSGGHGIGSPIKIAYGIETLFLTGAMFGILALLLLLLVKETKKKEDSVLPMNDFVLDSAIETPLKKQMPTYRKFIPYWDEIIAPEVVQPSVLMFLTAMVSGVYMVSVPDFSQFLGLENKGSFYLTNVAFMVVTRFVAGKYYDKYGARRNLYVGLSLMILGLLVTATSLTVAQFLLSSVIFGIAASICSPAIFAWTADLADPTYKGRGMSTMFIALELGIASGALLTQLVYNNDYANFFNLFAITALFCLVGILYLYLTRRIKPAISSE